MNSLSKPISTDFPYRLTPADPGISVGLSSRLAEVWPRQRGVVLFFTLIALLAMSLAVVALIRSVDTNAMIAGNLAFRQAATSSGDAGIEAAVGWLRNTELANSANVLNDPAHPFNHTGGFAGFVNPGYYSNLDTTMSLTDPIQPLHISWTDADSVSLGTDSTTGNSVRYIIQRMCRDANQAIQNTRCLFGNTSEDPNPQNIPYPDNVCKGDGCPKQGETPLLRITSRTEGPRNSVSYVQTIVY